MMDNRLCSVALGALLAVSPAFSKSPVGYNDRAENVMRQDLSSGWEFRQERFNDWYPATVPGTVHTDLMDNGLIEDPYFALNERSVQWVDKEDWRYRTTFRVDGSVASSDRVNLVFEGLDTYAEVFLNGERLFYADNMFREWKADVKGRLKDGDNELEILFHSPIKVDLPKHDSLPYEYEAINDQSQNGGLFGKRVSVFARKAGYHYGWDWGPRLVTSGVWRPVYLEAWNDAVISDVYYRPEDVSAKKAHMSATVEVESLSDMEDALIVIKADGRKVADLRCDIKSGMNSIEIPFTMKNPRLWWTRELGEPYMYSFEASLVKDESTVTSRKTDVGIRSLELVRDTVPDGVTFYMKLNGEPLFMKGANYIPCDVFLPRVTREIYEKTIADAVDVNMNMLRVWGGGIYENEYFYDLCDRNGILVWQDFMFACSTYPVDGELEDNIRAEAEYNLKRLRNHPCIAIWCGNNECNDAWYGWGWNQTYTKQGHPEYDSIKNAQFEHQYYELLPGEVAKFSPHTPYHPSSPWSSKYAPSDPSCGDMHNWSVWHGKAPISSYNTTRSRFFSEYGFQSFPGIESIRRYVRDERDWKIDSDVMMAHQRGGSFANMRIAQYMEDEYWKPEDFEDFIYMSHILQGDAIKAAIEAHRRDKPYCWGSLFWQHNDCWPVASWASRDWYGCWKAQHYFARYAFDDILVSPVITDGKYTVTLVSDRRSVVSGRLEVKVMDLDGKIIDSYGKTVKAAPNSSSVCCEGLLPEGADPAGTLLYVTFTAGEKTYSNIAMFSLLRDMKLPVPELDLSVEKTEDGYDVTVSSDKFARGVWLTIDGTDHHFSDNYFDLLPGASRTVSVKTGLPEEQFRSQLRVMNIAMTR